ncbi:MAG TPA: DsbE family thiol:disulfide interchange protein [Gammaproteobacteria bacterium]|nr:DsbE family thiol:disulfide interchange protein [Gammaproteobacteria bacterium]
MWKFLPLVLFVVLAWFLLDGLGKDPKKLPSPLIGKSFPNLEVEDFYSGERYFTQSKLKNKISLVNVWASWCVTCRAEHKVLNDIAATSDLYMIGINYKDTKKEGKRFLDILGDPFKLVVFDHQGKLGLELGVYATPETFILDHDGVIRFKHIGEITPNIWQNEILPLINKLKI